MTSNMSRRLLVSGAAFFFFSACPTAFGQNVLVLPYLQPGDGRTLHGMDVKVIRWLTDQKEGEFTVEYRVGGGPFRTVVPSRTTLDFPALAAPKKEAVKSKEDAPEEEEDELDATDAKVPQAIKDLLPTFPDKDQHYYRYTAHLTELPFNCEVFYRVQLAGQIIREAKFHTRATADKSVRCVLVGDLAQGWKSQRNIAFQIHRQKPEFVVALGDIVYSTGRFSQYMAYFWGTYNNVAEPSPHVGAPLMADTTFYAVLGNHDVGAKLSRTPDALAAYYFFSPPRSGPGAGAWNTPLDGDDAVTNKFLAATQDSYPALDAYSFDYGAAHFVVLNNNPTMKIQAPEFLHWLRADLMGTKAEWKLVCFHMPGFQSSIRHYSEQQIRPLSPLFEECGVDLTFAGHVHNYQRSLPLKFAPDPSGQMKKGKVEGSFTLDTVFDGATKTTPKGIIHIVSGGGGAALYGPGLDRTAPYLKEFYGANYADYTARMVVDKHSFVTLDISPKKLNLQALGAGGEVLDAVIITKTNTIR